MRVFGTSAIAIVAAAAAQNLIQNGGFDGDLSGWTDGSTLGPNFSNPYQKPSPAQFFEHSTFDVNRAFLSGSAENVAQNYQNA